MLSTAHLPVNPLDVRCIALGGGGGGVGRSTIACELAEELSQRGRTVLLVDAALHGGSHAIRLPQTSEKATPTQTRVDHFPQDLQKAVLQGERGAPSRLSLSEVRGGAAFPSRLRAQALITALKEGHWDDVILDLDGRPDGFNASILALADVPIFVTTTEATSLDQCIETIRQFIVYSLLLQPEADTVERRLLDALESLPSRFNLDALQHAFEHPSIHPLLHHIMQASTPWLLLNQTRDAAERILAYGIAYGMSKLTGLRPRILGTIGWDNDRAGYVRAGSLQEPLRGPGDTVTLIAQRLLQLGEQISEQPRLPYHAPHSAFDIVGVPQTAAATDVRRAWRALWDGLRQNSNFTQYILPAETREQLLYHLEEANRELQPWLAAQQEEKKKTPAARPPHDPPFSFVQKLRAARQQKEWTAQDLALRCQIGIRYLEAIEAFEINALPRDVYLIGYLREIARALELNEDELVNAYITELQKTREAALMD